MTWRARRRGSGGIDPAATPAVCPGPNIVNFSRVATLQEMVGHIYGRSSLLNGSPRPHMFLRELALYIDHLRSELAKEKIGLASHPGGYFAGVRGEPAQRRRLLPRS